MRGDCGESIRRSSRSSPCWRTPSSRRASSPLKSFIMMRTTSRWPGLRPRRRDGPLAVDHAGRHIPLMMQNTVVDVRYLPGKREGDEVGKSTLGKLADLPAHAQGTGAVKWGHLDKLDR